MGIVFLLAGTGKKALEIVERNSISLVFLDLNLPDIGGIKVLKSIMDFDDKIIVIIITGYASVESTIEAMRIGAYDYIKKPFKSDAIKVITKLGLEKFNLRRQINYLQKEKAIKIDDEMIGACKKMLDIGKQIVKIAKTDSPVLVEGESGTGKELLVKLIHKTSDRAKGPLIQVNCSAIPETLMENEFFGHEKGTFTGALNKKKGLIEQSDGGILNLDEIADMQFNLQAKMLRFIEGGIFRRVGGSTDMKADIRIIASTNKDLSNEVKKKKFRLDLFYRLNVLTIKLPPLTNRGEDILLLANYWIKKNNLKFGKNVTSISPAAKKLLLSYSWPGNVRELKNVIERICLLLPEQTNTLLPEHIQLNQLGANNSFLLKNYLSRFFEPNIQINKGFNYNQVIQDINFQIKKRIFDQALLLTNGNKTKAANMLGLSRAALWREMKKLR
jgi:DNA-binding NtrC family response regulator